MKKITISLTLMLALLATAWTSNAQTKTKTDQNEVKYVKIEVNGLACPFCVYGIEKKLKKVKNAKDVQVSLKGGYATFQVPSDEIPSKAVLKKVITDAGFQAKKITYADKPFNQSDAKKE